MRTRPVITSILAFCLAFFTATLGHAAENVSFTFKEHGETVKTLSLAELVALTQPVTKSFNDALAQQSITYKAVSLTALLEKIYGKRVAQSEGLLFTCRDGFQPFMPHTAFKKAEAFLAFEREGQKSFSLNYKAEGNKLVSLAPFYLVWDAGKDTANKEWAYQIVGVDLINFAEHFPQTAPPTDSSAQAKRGFLSFQKNCLSCHTINGEGGGKAPELNYPVNVTEYYNETWLRKWIAQPTDIRFSTTMPPLAVPAEEQQSTITDLIAYLKAMAHNKRAP